MYHPVIEDVRRRLAEVHSVAKERIVIKDIYAGTGNVVYTVDDLTDKEKDRLIKEAPAMEQKMKKMFGGYRRLEIHPALFHNSYDVSMFDARGNKTFTEAQVLYLDCFNSPGFRVHKETSPNSEYVHQSDLLSTQFGTVYILANHTLFVFSFSGIPGRTQWSKETVHSAQRVDALWTEGVGEICRR